MMPEEKEELIQLKPKFVYDPKLPIQYVNVVNVVGGLDEFFITLGIAAPFEVNNVEELKLIDTVEAQPYFRCAVSRTSMKLMIDLMQKAYEQQSKHFDLSSQQQKEEL